MREEICGAMEPTGAKGDDGGPARCARKPHPAGTMHEGNGLDWYDVAAPDLAADAPAMLELLREIGSDDPDYIGPDWWRRVTALLDKHGRG